LGALGFGKQKETESKKTGGTCQYWSSLEEVII
jgi:hypothetical protein